MHTVTIKKDIYQFNELSDSAKETARDWYREGNLNYEWWDFIYEDTKRIGNILGIDIDDIYFSGFSCQGDGACFTGFYSYAKESVTAIKAECPKDTELHEIAEGLYKLQRGWFYRLSANIKQSGHYNHEYYTDIDILENDEYLFSSRPILGAEGTLTDLLRDFMRWIYKSLETEYNWLMSNESIDENILANEYEFEVDGSRYI